MTKQFVVNKKGRRTAVVLGIKEYEELLEDLDDLKTMLSRKRERSIPWEEAKARLRKRDLL
ncbi:MAG: hypothetical protein A3E19_03045 [Planctomycetes bacterium RIFCSPHIGHO2_12_FULL_52_36]|nr:type II toxin-antitoxin system prevent-host-death family antitoxin [Candidatus Brocadiaceae bacterium]OHB90952.1 MAG: hypothetical protein A3D89_00060 [Planctomycetes bacterium RIFCSPHIGHO2_02_FULL_52_58]OHB94303.1 MAG: hypothetical protein A3E19_03045 [Planctomycetes bacterium RIFCSPHIGHO2_12_FULL_52_36]